MGRFFKRFLSHRNTNSKKNNDSLFFISYRPPQGRVSELLKSFHSMLGYESENILKYCVGGDFNMDIAAETPNII